VTGGLKLTRRLSQAAVAVGFPVLAWFNAQGWEQLSGNFVSFSFFGHPLADPLAAVQVCASSLSLPWRMVLGGATALALAVVLGTVFCSWVCPFGFLSELAISLKSRQHPPGKTGWQRKAVITATASVLLAVFGMPPLLNQLSLPGWYTRIFQAWFNQQEFAILGFALIGAALCAEAVAGKRLWCRYVCPQSVLLNIVHRFSPVGLRVRFDPSRCTCKKGDEQCGKACSLGLNPRMAGKGLEWECSVCGDCTTSCATRGGALTLGFGRGVKKTS